MTARTSRRRILATAAAWVAGLAVPAAVRLPATRLFAGREPLDLLIAGGTIVDGTGGRRFAGDVGIRRGRIEQVGRPGGAGATRRIDAAGLIVAPGFIDVHTHSDRTLLADGLAHSAIRQGATTHVIGNCGSSPAPARAGGEAPAFATYGEFLAALTASGSSVNIGGLVGHNTIRESVMGLQNRPPTEVEMRKMRDAVDEALRAGAVGLSTGLVSPPGAWSTTEEIIELARVAAKGGGLYASHMRGEASTVVDSVREALRIGREAGVPVQISHHKAAGRENWGRTRETLPLIEAARREGVNVHVDVYPYRAGSAGLSQFVPPWAHEGGTGELLSRLRDPETRRRIAREMTDGTNGWPNFFRVDWDDIQITSTATDANRPWVGKKVGDVARARGCGGVEACIDLLIEEQGAIGMINFIMDEEDVRRVLRHPLAMIGSDGSALNAADRRGSPHPRSYGCFPRALGRYCRELELFPLETAIHKMTGMPAAQLGWPDRGVIRTDAAADIVLFDFERVIDRATFDEPHQYPEGIRTVIVNGEVVLDAGVHTGARPGKNLRPQRG